MTDCSLESKYVVVGGGLIGMIVTDWLVDHNIEFTWIVPNRDDPKANQNKKLFEAHMNINRQSLSYSPKLLRQDYILDANQADVILEECETNNFLLSRSVRVGGLANYWGGNTCKKFVMDRLCKDIDVKARNYTLSAFKTMTYEDISKCKGNDSESKKVKRLLEEVFNVTGLRYKVYNSDLALNSPPDTGEDFIEYNRKIKGNIAKDGLDKAINGAVTKISRDGKNYLLKVKLLEEKKLIVIKSRTLLMCTGPIESLRLVFSICPEYRGTAVAIRHHPLITGFLYMRGGVGREVSDWPLSCFDIAVESDSKDTVMPEWFANIIPVHATLQAKAKRNKIIKILLSLKWIMQISKNIMVVNIYLPADLTASYVFSQNTKGSKKMILIGNYHPNLIIQEKNIIRKIGLIFRSRYMRGVFFRMLAPGSDQHTSSTVWKFCDQYGHLKEGDQQLGEGGVYFLGGSSAESMPICNPTYYFSMRAINIMEYLKKEGIIK